MVMTRSHLSDATQHQLPAGTKIPAYDRGKVVPGIVHLGVGAFHRAALAAGGRDNGKPGLREDYGPNYFAAFVVDPDGYRIEAYSSSES